MFITMLHKYNPHAMSKSAPPGNTPVTQCGQVMVTMVLLLHPSYFYPGLATPAWQRPVCGHLWQERDITGNYS